MSEISCKTCCYWSEGRAPGEAAQPVSHSFGAAGIVDQRPAFRLGQCRRFPPFMAQTAKGLRAQWPMLTSEQWCGEHGVIEANRI